MAGSRPSSCYTGTDEEVSVFARLARFLIRRRKPVLIASGVFFVAAGALGGSVADHLSRGGFDDPAAESVKARHRLEDEFGAGLPAYVLVVTPTSGGVRGVPAVADHGGAPSGASNDEAVARGLDRAGPVVTAAAFLMAIVFGAMLISGLTFLKQTASA
ncbi:MAG: MMPL family transporter [Acidimicrobiia bacterium]